MVVLIMRVVVEAVLEAAHLLIFFLLECYVEGECNGGRDADGRGRVF